MLSEAALSKRTEIPRLIRAAAARLADLRMCGRIAAGRLTRTRPAERKV